MQAVRKPLCWDPFSLEPRGFRGCLIEAIRRSGSRARGRSPRRFGPVQPVPVVPVLLAMARVSQWTRGGRDHVCSHVGHGRRPAEQGPAAASSAASVFVHSLPTIRTLVGTDGRLTGPILIKGAHPARTPEIDGNGVLESNGGSEGRDGGTLSDKLPAEVVFGARIVGVDGGGQPPRRVQGSTGTHVFVDLAGAPAPILVVPEVHVVVTAHRLRAESTADLHAWEKE